MAVASLKDRIPPHNDEAEAATLGALLLDGEAVTKIIPILRPDDFYKTGHQKICRAIIDLDARSEAIDLITLTEELKKKGELDVCGGASYISRLTSTVPTSANIEYYAKIVQENSLRRSMIKIASEMISHNYDDSLEVREIIEEAEKKIFELTDKQFSGSYLCAKDIINPTIDAIEKHYKNKGNYTGIPSGFRELDELTSGFQDSEFIIIGARPSVGKTALALTMAGNMAIKSKIPVGFFTLEMSNMALMQRMLSSEARLDTKKIRSGLLKRADFNNLMNAASKIYEAPLFIEDTPNLRLLDLRALARRMVAIEKVQIIFIDYITLITSETKDLPRHEQIAEISRSLKALARELNIPVVVLSQVRRETEGKVPTLADIRESGSIEQDADVVIFIHREKKASGQPDEQPKGEETEIIIAKQRNGPIGSLRLTFLKEYTKFENRSSEDMP
ncbi:MAG: replicative DNA helicase [Spirochaetales bacterium]|nr:replicative DNA helicase [Spirochaetales bacterium]